MKKSLFRCGNLRILLLLCLIVSTQTALKADIVKGRVVDAETKEPIPEAQVKYTQQTDNYGYSIRSAQTDSLGNFTIFADGRGKLEVFMLGYNTMSKTVLAFSNSQKDTIDIGTMELKMAPQMLKMVEVKGHARRFTVKGDTIVFHPEAFHLQEGARLDELIKQLPGVQMGSDGKLSWNGKPIRITMDGESLFGGDDLVKQLPAEAVENIKAYNKQSEFSKRTGKDDGTQDMVLDLNIKPGFLDRWYGDVKAYYQSPKYYNGELLMNRLSKTDPLMVFANANNIDRHWRRNMKGSSAYMNNGFGKEQGISAGYQHNGKVRKEGSQELKSFYSFTGGLAHDDDWQTLNQLTENYFPNTAATRISTENHQRAHKLEPRLNANLQWMPDSLNTFWLIANVEHSDSRSYSHQRSEQEDAFGIDYMPTLSQQNTTNTNGHETKLNALIVWEHYVKDGALGASVKLDYQDGKTDGLTNRTITAHTQSYSSSQFTQTYTSPARQFSTTAEAHHARWLTGKWMIQAQYILTYDHNRKDQDFMTNGMADDANSYHQLYTHHEHGLRISQTINLNPVQLMPTVSTRWQREGQDYQRGMLDTTAVRHYFFVDPSLRATWKLSKTIGLELNYAFTTKQPDILKTIGYRDLTDPYFITEGNPHLRNTHTHTTNLTYNMVLAHSQTSFSTSASYTHNNCETTTALSYDPKTAIYTSRPENVKGSKSWTFRLNIDQSLGDYLRLQSDFHLNAGKRYGYLTFQPTQQERTLNRQSSMNPRENLTFSFDYNWLKASVYAEIAADRLRYTASPEQNTTHWNNNFGLNAEISLGNFYVYTSLNERISRGHTLSSMNRNILVWDSSVTWKILKNKARITLELDDILNSEDGRWSEQSAYQQTTSWQKFRHHYVGISFTYHLDAKKKE